jgi:hypothetical protein
MVYLGLPNLKMVDLSMAMFDPRVIGIVPTMIVNIFVPDIDDIDDRSQHHGRELIHWLMISLVLYIDR